MADFRETDPKKMNFPSLAERSQYFKNTEGGVESMCRVMEEVREEGRMEGRNQMIVALLVSNSEEELLYADRFKSLNITQKDIDAAKKYSNS